LLLTHPALRSRTAQTPPLQCNGGTGTKPGGHLFSRSTRSVTLPFCSRPAAACAVPSILRKRSRQPRAGVPSARHAPARTGASRTGVTGRAACPPRVALVRPASHAALRRARRTFLAPRVRRPPSVLFLTNGQHGASPTATERERQRARGKEEHLRHGEKASSGEGKGERKERRSTTGWVGRVARESCGGRS